MYYDKDGFLTEDPELYAGETQLKYPEKNGVWRFVSGRWELVFGVTAEGEITSDESLVSEIPDRNILPGETVASSGEVEVKFFNGKKYLAISGMPMALQDGPPEVVGPILPYIQEVRSVAMVGLGAGNDAKAVASIPSTERVDVIEISPEVIEMLPLLCDDLPSNCRIIQGDAAVFFGSEVTQMYDLIVSDPEDMTVSHSSALFSPDVISKMKDHLSEGGIFAQRLWFHSDKNQEAFLDILSTVFKSVAVVSALTNRVNYTVMASDSPIQGIRWEKKKGVNNESFKEMLNAELSAKESSR